MNRPPTHRLDQRFEEQVARTPELVALTDDWTSVTFAELESEANRLAAGLVAQGVTAGSFVGLHIERSVLYVAALLAVLKAGSTVVPLPPSYPEERLRDILSFAKLDAVLDDARTPLAPALHGRILHYAALRDATPSLTPAPASAVASAVASDPAQSDDQPAFVLCSSGSTGTPKMIVRSHRSFFHRLEWTWATHPYTANDVCCQKAHMTTTHAIYELFEPLLQGVPVHIISDQGARSLEQFWDTVAAKRVSRLLIVPSVLQASLDMAGFEAPGLDVLVLMGEYVHKTLAARAIAAFPAHTRIYSIYGSTEASSTLLCDLRASYRAGEELPLGRPISADVTAHVLDDNLQDVKAGEAGMLHIAGTPLFTGYFGDPGLTASSFISRNGGSERFYRTHDQVRQLPDGGLQFIGRVDHTVKIRGFRVDLEEVERALLTHPDVRQCAVVVDGGEGDASLLAFVVPSTVAPSSVFQRLREQLPAYMVPSTIVSLDAVPLTASGKIDRKALLAEHRLRATQSSTGRALTDTEERVAKTWQDVLQPGAVQAESNFFEVGGTSLKVFSVAERLRKAFALERAQLSDITIYQYPTVESLASYIDGVRAGTVAPSSSSARDTTLVTLKSGTNAALPPLFVIASAGGTVGAYEKVSRELVTDREIIGVRDPFLWGERDPSLPFNEWVARYVSAIRGRQAVGPYYIMAYSSGGSFGFEIAHQLRHAGQEVALLALVDPVLLDSTTRLRYGYWGFRARGMRESFRRVVLLGGRARALWPWWMRRLGPAPRNDFRLEGRELETSIAGSRKSAGHIASISALLELNTGLPFALTAEELANIPPERLMDTLVARVRTVAPDVDPATIERIVEQYGLQARAQHHYRLPAYGGPVVLFTTDGPQEGLLAAQIAPYVRSLEVHVLHVDTPSPHIARLAEWFTDSIRMHYLSMRDDSFVKALAAEMAKLLQKPR